MTFFALAESDLADVGINILKQIDRSRGKVEHAKFSAPTRQGQESWGKESLAGAACGLTQGKSRT